MFILIVLVPRKTTKFIYKQPVPRTDTRRQVENTKAFETTRDKELGKKADVTSG